ncbi:hypothetical protein Ancab_009121 [Ancistrocladus abbreviatus]
MASVVQYALLSLLSRQPQNFGVGNRRIRCSSSERQALFNRIAPFYDNLIDLLSLGQHRVWKRMAVSWSGAKKGDCVLDLCCGSGDLAFLLSDKVGIHGKVIGLDFSKKQLQIALSRKNLRLKASYKNIEWVEGNALDLPFCDDYFDAITMGYGLRNVVDKEKAVAEMFRVLKPGSKVSILDFNKSNHQLPPYFRESTRYTPRLMFKTTIDQGPQHLRPTACKANLEWLIFNTTHEWMIDNVVVPIGSSYGLAEECKYLKSSIQEFLTGEELEQLALTAGFSNAKFYEVAGGLMGNLVAMR